MDAKTSISLSIDNLQDLLDHDELTSINPSLQKQMQTAINNLRASKRLLKDVDVLDHEASSGGSEIDHVQLLEAVYSAEDAIDALLMRKEFQRIRKCIEDDLEGFKRFTHKMKSFSRRIPMKSFTEKMKKFNNEVGRLLESKEVGNSDIENNDNRTPLSSFQNEFCLEEETKLVLSEDTLNEEDSWSLFADKVQMAKDESNNSQLITLKKQIMDLCGRTPSSIELLAGLLLSARKKSNAEWSRVLRMVENNARGNIITLSYKDLPQEVKPCFLYMGLFPREFDIPVRRLIHLWCAEGFMIPKDHEDLANIDPEDLAEMCLEELITRKMVQVRWSLDGSPKTCRMPSILYDFFSPKAANVGFLYHHFQSSQTSQKEPKFAVRRLAAYTGNKDLPPFQHLRSYVALNDRHDVDRPGMIIFNEGFGVLLKLLDLEGVYKPKLSGNVVKKLLQLRYLGLRSTFIDDLSDSMKYLSNLEALDVKHTNIHSISIPKASKLRHVYLDYQIQNHQDIISRLVSSNLRTLWRLEVSVNCLKKYRDLFFCMRKLRKLGLIFCTKMFEFNTMAEWINQLTELQSLKLRSIDSHHQASIIDLMTMANHHKLQQLYLRGYLPQSAIDVLYLPPNLKKLTLSLSQLEKDPMPVLERLPHLNILRLYPRSYIGVKMTCGSQRFPKLRLLKLWNIPIQDWTVEEGAMPCLRELEISSCKKLELPQWLQNVTSLKEIVLRDMPTLFGAAVEKSLQDRGVEIKFSNLFRLYDSKE